MSEVLLRSRKIASVVSPQWARSVTHFEKEIIFVSCCLFLANLWWLLLISLLFRCLEIFYLIAHFFLEIEVIQAVYNFSAPFLLKIETMVVQRQFPGSSFTLTKFLKITVNSRKISSVSSLSTLGGNSSGLADWKISHLCSFSFRGWDLPSPFVAGISCTTCHLKTDLFNEGQCRKTYFSVFF